MSSDGAVPTFGRGDGTARLTDLGCPDCPGVLSVRTEGKKGYLWFQCRTGHAYSVESLLEEKEEALEATLWSSVTRLDELLSLYRELIARAKERGQLGVVAEYSKRVALGETTVAQLRTIAESNAPPVDPPVGQE